MRAKSAEAIAAWNDTPEAAAMRERAGKAGREAQKILHAAGGTFRDGQLKRLAQNRAQPGFQERRVARLRQVLAAKRAVTTAKVVALRDAGRTHAEIVAELGLSPTYVSVVLSRAGRKFTYAERKRPVPTEATRKHASEVARAWWASPEGQEWRARKAAARKRTIHDKRQQNPFDR
jgi:hypothetical protein